MSRWGQLLLGGIWLLLCCGPGQAAAPLLQAEFGSSGLTQLRTGQDELLLKSAPYVEFFIARTGRGVEAVSPGEPTWSWDVATRTGTQAYPWGVVRCQFAPAANRLDLLVTVENRSPEPVAHCSIHLLEVKLPKVPPGEAWQQGQVSSENIDAPASILADFGSGALALASETFDEDFLLGFRRLHGAPPEHFAVNLSSLPRRSSDTIHQDFPLAAGAVKQYRVSLRFGPRGSSLLSLTGDLYQQWARKFPSRMQWKDRRPIGSILLSSSAGQHQSRSNPRGWFNDPKLDAVSPRGRKKWEQRVSRWADESIQALQRLNAQGMIFWDLEGEELPHPTTFIGDPRLVGKFAPEMEAVADLVFRKFTAAGLRTGVCIRPSRIRPNPDRKAAIPVVHDHMDFDPVAEMSAKIDYAKRRWGCSLFYVDTNVTWAFALGTKPAEQKTVSWPMRAEPFRRLAEAHPDVLIIPEFQRLGYHTHTSAYRELSAGHTSTAEEVLLAYPRAFSIIKVEDAALLEREAGALVRSVRHGDILLCPGWYMAPSHAWVRRIYEAAAGQGRRKQ